MCNVFPFSFADINVSIMYSISAMSRKKRVLRARQKSTWTLTNATRHACLGRGRSRTLGERRLVGLTQFPLPTRSHPATACSSSREQEHRNALEAAFWRRSTWYSRYLPHLVLVSSSARNNKRLHPPLARIRRLPTVIKAVPLLLRPRSIARDKIMHTVDHHVCVQFRLIASGYYALH